jgi:hypothetical protein
MPALAAAQRDMAAMAAPVGNMGTRRVKRGVEAALAAVRPELQGHRPMAEMAAVLAS